MATEAERPVVERLDVDNYATWRTRMKFLLISKGLRVALPSRWLRWRSGHHHRLPLVKRIPLHQEILKSDTGWQSYQKTRPRGSFRGVVGPAVPGTPLLPPPSTTARRQHARFAH